MSAVIQLDGVRVLRGGRAILDVPALEIGRGELVSVIGPNGAGKSTLLKVMALILPPDVGTIRLNGERAPLDAPNCDALLAARRRVTMVFQSPALLSRTVRDNVAVGLRFRDFAESEVDARVDTWLERLGIADLADRSPRGLSGGEAQRVALARALVLEPDLLLLDEPTANLDWPTRSRLLGDLREILSGISASAVLVTHEVREAPYFADRMLVMAEGSVARRGRPADVIANPGDLRTAMFLGYDNILPASVLQPELYLDAHASVNRLYCIRPEDVVVSPISAQHENLAGEAGVAPARIRLTGKVSRVAPWGPVYRVTIELSRSPQTQVTGTAAQSFVLHDSISVGRPAAVEFTPGAGVMVEESPS